MNNYIALVNNEISPLGYWLSPITPTTYLLKTTEPITFRAIVEIIERVTGDRITFSHYDPNLGLVFTE